MFTSVAVIWGQTLNRLQADVRLRLGQSTMAYGVAATAARGGVSLLLLPLLRACLTDGEMAIWWQFLALGSFANLADFGFGGSIARVFSYLWAGTDDFKAEGLRPSTPGAQPNLPKIRQLSVAARRLYLFLSLGVLAGLATFGTAALLRPITKAGGGWTLWIAWATFAASVVYSLATSHWTLGCQGVNRMRQLQKAYLWSSLAYAAVVAALLLAGWGLIAMVTANFVRGYLIREICKKDFCKVIGDFTAASVPSDPTIIRRLWTNAYKLGIISVGAVCIGQGNVLVCGNFLDSATTAMFGLTQQMATFIANFAVLWISLKWPQLTIMRTQGQSREMAALFARRLALTMASFIVLAAGIMLFGDRLIALKGSSKVLLPAVPLAFYLAYIGVQLFYVQFGTLTYTENVVPFAKIAVSTGLGMIILSSTLTRHYGLWGMLWAPVIAEGVYSSWFTVRRGFHGQPLSVREFVRAAVFGWR